MATYVVDANVIVQACVDAAGLGSLASHDLKAPPVMRSEALSSLHEMRYRGEVSTELAGLALKRLSAMAVEILGPKSLARMAWDVAESLGWAKTYDAEYVALAQILECPVVTLDARMARGARRLTRIIGPGDVATEVPVRHDHLATRERRVEDRP
jgi:predicted nucleic acid-binding protein